MQKPAVYVSKPSDELACQIFTGGGVSSVR